MSLLPLGILSASGAGGAGSFELISTQVLGSNSASVTFSSIPQTYKHLQIRYVAQTTPNISVVGARFNSDSTSANYTRHVLYGDGSSAGSYGNTSNGVAELGRLDIGTNNYGFGVADILDYTSTNKYKTTRAFAGSRGSSNPFVAIHSGLWLSTAAISSITLIDPFYSQNFLTNSRFSLYGIKG